MQRRVFGYEKIESNYFKSQNECGEKHGANNNSKLVHCFCDQKWAKLPTGIESIQKDKRRTIEKKDNYTCYMYSSGSHSCHFSQGKPSARLRCHLLTRYHEHHFFFGVS